MTTAPSIAEVLLGLQADLHDLAAPWGGRCIVSHSVDLMAQETANGNPDAPLLAVVLDSEVSADDAVARPWVRRSFGVLVTMRETLDRVRGSSITRSGRPTSYAEVIDAVRSRICSWVFPESQAKPRRAFYRGCEWLADADDQTLSVKLTFDIFMPVPMPEAADERPLTFGS